MTKTELYESIIDFQKQSGQGISGIIIVHGPPEVKKYMEELIEEGLIVRMTLKYNSIGHPESSNFYLSSKGYNVWKEGQSVGYDIQYLSHIRLYLNCLDDSEKTIVQDLEFLKDYLSWLERNKEELEIMKNLSNIYIDKSLILSSAEIDWAKSNFGYKTNLKIKNYLQHLDDHYILQNKILKITKEIEKISAELDSNTIKSMEDAEAEIKYCKKIKNYLSSKDQIMHIQDVIS